MNRGQLKARRKAVADSRNDAGIKRQRTLLRTYPDYETASDAQRSIIYRTDDETRKTAEFQIRKNRDGFGVYRREVVK